MARYLLDSSALLKRYYDEAGSAWMRALCGSRTRPVLYISQVSHVEVVAALRRTGRTKHEHPSYIDALVGLFTRHIARQEYEIVPTTRAVTTLAAWLCNKYWAVDPGPLRSLDAIHLASALAAVANRSDELALVTADMCMAAVAAFEGLRVVNPAYPPRREFSATGRSHLVLQ